MTYTGSSGLLKASGIQFMFLILKAVCCSLVFSEDATFSPYWLVRNLESDLVAKLAKLPVLCQHLQQHGEATQTDLTLVPCPVLRQTL